MQDSSTVHNWVRRHEYRDSMVLMNFSAQLESVPGVLRAMAIMGTENNKRLLAAVGLLGAESAGAGPNDLIVAVRSVDREAATEAASRLEQMLTRRAATTEGSTIYFNSVESAAQALPGADLAVISVPGLHAAREARRALDLGLHVFLFSDNVPLAEEIALKQLASERGLLVMGPDCGTAIINGAALGFANVVRKGNVGIVGAAGTGIQEVSSLLDRVGLGISHALGTGGRDLWTEVGAITTTQALDLLDKDPETSVLVLISKLSSPAVAEKVIQKASGCHKPVLACLLGQDPGILRGASVRVLATLSETVQAAAATLGCKPTGLALCPKNLAEAARERAALASDQRFVRGLFSGGSLCEEAMVVWRDSLGPVWSNVPLDPSSSLPDPMRSREHTAIDLGDDYFTAGRPHPMIDPGVRRDRLLAEADDPTVGVIVLDVVLGYGTHPDMAGALLPAIVEAQRKAAVAGRHLSIVAHVCGTESDPQGLAAQEQKLRSAGVITLSTNAAAAYLAALIVTGIEPEELSK